ncbi:MAG: hypothetical protein AB1762_15325 [Gemmatimonadota bacterium]
MDQGPREREDVGGVWKGDGSLAGIPHRVELLAHVYDDSVLTLGVLDSASGFFGLGRVISAGRAIFQIGEAFQPFVGTLELEAQQLRGDFRDARDTSGRFVFNLSRLHGGSNSLAGRWIVTETFRTLSPPPDVSDTLYLTRVGTYKHARAERFPGGFSCYFWAVGAYRVVNSTLQLKKWSYGTTPCLVDPAETLSISGNRIIRKRRPSRTDSIVDTYTRH